MGEIVFYCNDPFKQGCHWSGYEGELVCQEDDPEGEKEFNHCPYCEGTDFQEEDEGDDEE